MWIDAGACIECGLCEELAPGIRGEAPFVAVTARTLDAMSACPTGAIRWLEGKEEA